MNTGFIFPGSLSSSNLTTSNTLESLNESPIYRAETNIKPNTRNIALKDFFTNKIANLQQLEVNGTSTKFYPPTGQDLINRSGRSLSVKTNHQCLTRMKEYESKSLEELRLEDYQSNRKFKQPSNDIVTKTTETDLKTAENKVKMITNSIQNQYKTPSNENKSNAYIKRSKNEMINHFNSLQNEINHRTELTINRLNNHRHRMIKDLEIQKRLVIEEEVLDSDETDESKTDLNETIVKQDTNTDSNNQTLRNDPINYCDNSHKSKIKLSLSPTPTRSLITDSSSSLSNFTASTANSFKSATSLNQSNHEVKQTQSIFSRIFFVLFFVYIFIWFVKCNRLRVFL